MNRRVAVRAIIIKDGKLLAMKAKPYHDHVTTGIWFTIGGSLDEGEDVLTGLRREVIEETGVDPIVGNLLYVHQFKDEHKEHLQLLFHVTNPEDFINIDLSKTTHGDEEVEEIRFIDASKEDLYPVFLRQESFDDLANQPTKFFSYL